MVSRKTRTAAFGRTCLQSEFSRCHMPADRTAANRRRNLAGSPDSCKRIHERLSAESRKLVPSGRGIHSEFYLILPAQAHARCSVPIRTSQASGLGLADSSLRPPGSGIHLG